MFGPGPLANKWSPTGGIPAEIPSCHLLGLERDSCRTRNRMSWFPLVYWDAQYVWTRQSLREMLCLRPGSVDTPNEWKRFCILIDWNDHFSMIGVCHGYASKDSFLARMCLCNLRVICNRSLCTRSLIGGLHMISRSAQYLRGIWPAQRDDSLGGCFNEYCHCLEGILASW
jgi:hypothetical protein